MEATADMIACIAGGLENAGQGSFSDLLDLVIDGDVELAAKGPSGRIWRATAATPRERANAIAVEFATEGGLDLLARVDSEAPWVPIAFAR